MYCVLKVCPLCETIKFAFIMADTADDVSGNREDKIMFKPKKRKQLRTREVQSDDSDDRDEEVDL